MSTFLDFWVQGKFAQAGEALSEGPEPEEMGEAPTSIEDLVKNIPLDSLTDEELAALAEESPVAQEEKDDREEEEEDEQAEGVSNEMLADKLAQANDFLGRIFANAVVDELNKLAAETENKGEDEVKKDKKEAEKEKSARSKVVDALSVIQGRATDE